MSYKIYNLDCRGKNKQWTSDELWGVHRSISLNRENAIVNMANSSGNRKSIYFLRGAEKYFWGESITREEWFNGLAPADKLAIIWDEGFYF